MLGPLGSYTCYSACSCSLLQWLAQPFAAGSVTPGSVTPAEPQGWEGLYHTLCHVSGFMLVTDQVCLL